MAPSGSHAAQAGIRIPGAEQHLELFTSVGQTPSRSAGRQRSVLYAYLLTRILLQPPAPFPLDITLFPCDLCFPTSIVVHSSE